MVCAMTTHQVLTRCSQRSSMHDDQTGSVMSNEELRNRLLGTWQLVSSVIRFEEGEFRDQFGYEPSGFLICSAERRLDCTATQWAGKSAIENSAVAACTTAARGRHRI